MLSLHYAVFQHTQLLFVLYLYLDIPVLQIFFIKNILHPFNGNIIRTHFMILVPLITFIETFLLTLNNQFQIF